MIRLFTCFSFFYTPPPILFYTLSLHDALPISFPYSVFSSGIFVDFYCPRIWDLIYRRVFYSIQGYDSPGRGHFYYFFWINHCRRSEEHTSELQSRENLVCRLLLEKKK